MMPTTNNLRDWADNPAASGMVPVSPTSLRAVADLLDAQEAELAALKAGLAVIRDCFPAPAPAGALEQPWAEAMGAAECIPAYVAACIDARAAEIARLTREVESWYSQNQQHIQDAVDFAAERDAGFAEIDALQKDAARYIGLRAEAIYGMPSCEGSSHKGAYLVITGYGDDGSDATTNDAVDEAIAQAVQP